MEQAINEAREDPQRWAVVPEWLQVGREVWYWRELLCADDICTDGVTSACPLNRGVKWYEDEARSCAHAHPMLEKTTVWSVMAAFTPRGVEWIVNDLDAVADSRLREAFFRTAKGSRTGRPEVVRSG